MSGVTNRLICETSVAVVDLETTGLYPGGDRIVELAVVRVDPYSQPRLILDTLINPRRPVSATEIHGITDSDVIDAPTFEEAAGNLASAIKDCVFASYNVYFDAKFVQTELAQVGVHRFPPHLCLMYLRPLLGLGSKCSLSDACRCHGVDHTVAHWASADALAGARLWQTYTEILGRRGIRTFGEMVRGKAYKFTGSFTHDLLDASVGSALLLTNRLKSRAPITTPDLAAQRQVERQALVREYWDALTAALADLQVTRDEIQYLLAKQASLKLRTDDLRWLHARAFAGILADTCQDKTITSGEAAVLHDVSSALRQLGWAPGDEPEEVSPTAVLSAGPSEQVRRPWRRVINWFARRGPS